MNLQFGSEKCEKMHIGKHHAFESSSSKVFMMLEIGMIPVRFVLMKKRLQFLHYISSEPTETMLRRFNVIGDLYFGFGFGVFANQPIVHGGELAG